jgi:7-cyano-7-deazaguanine synthase
MSGMKTSGAVVLLSGGMDSAVTAAIALSENERVSFLHIRYGAKAQAREEAAFRALCRFWKVTDFQVTDLPSLSSFGGSALTDSSISIPEGSLEREGIPVTYVPFRNAHFLATATSLAEIRGANRIYIGAVEEDSSGYPDCRRIFYDAFTEAIRQGTKPGEDIRIITPVITFRKSRIVQEGLRLGVPFVHTWSCYQGITKPCGHCDSCLLRLRGFSEAGAVDPTEYLSQ